MFYFSYRLKTNRKAWSSPTCFSLGTNPSFVNFKGRVIEGGMSGITPETTGPGLVKFQCLPFYSLLLAIDNPTVNLLSLDIEGAEFHVS